MVNVCFYPSILCINVCVKHVDDADDDDHEPINFNVFSTQKLD